MLSFLIDPNHWKYQSSNSIRLLLKAFRTRWLKVELPNIEKQYIEFDVDVCVII